MRTAPHRSNSVYDVREIRPEEIPWMLRRNIWTGMLGSTSMTLITGGVFFTVYCQRMGMQNYQFGVLSTLAYLMLPLSLFSASVEERFGQRKYPWFMLAMVSRLMLLPLALGMFMRINPWVIVALMVGVVSISRLITPLWESWAWAYIPSESFGRFTAKRNFWTTLFRTVVALGFAAVVDGTAPAGRLRLISAVFAGLLVVGIIDLLYHVQIPEPPRAAPPARSVTKFREAFRNWRLRNLLFAIAVWYFAVGIGGPFCLPYMMGELGFGDTILAAVVLAAGIPAIGTLLVLRLWGRLCDGRRPALVMSVCCLCWAVIPLMYFYARPGTAVGSLAVAWIIAGIFPAGYTVALPLMTRRLSGSEKTVPSALIYMGSSFGMMLGSGVGTLIVRTYGTPDVFLVSFAARVTAALVMFLLLVYHPAVQKRYV